MVCLGIFFQKFAIFSDPKLMGLGPVFAIRKLMERCPWKLDETDCFELNEAFAAQSLGCIRELGIDSSKVFLFV